MKRTAKTRPGIQIDEVKAKRGTRKWKKSIFYLTINSHIRVTGLQDIEHPTDPAMERFNLLMDRLMENEGRLLSQFIRDRKTDALLDDTNCREMSFDVAREIGPDQRFYHIHIIITVIHNTNATIRVDLLKQLFYRAMDPVRGNWQKVYISVRGTSDAAYGREMYQENKKLAEIE